VLRQTSVAAMPVAVAEEEPCQSRQLLRQFEHQHDEHPLQWLQPTPELSGALGLELPLDCRFPGLIHDAARSPSSVQESASQASTVVGDCLDPSQEGCWEAGSCRSGEDGWPYTRPPQLTPRIPTCSSPPPPPAGEASELPSPSLMAWQTPSPTAAFAMCASIQLPHQGRPEQRSSEQQLLVAPPPRSRLLEAADGFSALGAWSQTPDEGSFIHTNRATQVALPSLGASQHEQGRCRPCAFVHRPVGCADGAACIFCHSCEPGEKKRRQKQKFKAARQRRLCRTAAAAGAPKAGTGTAPVPQIVPSSRASDAATAHGSSFRSQQQQQQQDGLCGQATSTFVTEVMSVQTPSFAVQQQQQQLQQQRDGSCGQVTSACLTGAMAPRFSSFEGASALGTAPSVARASGWAAGPR